MFGKDKEQTTLEMEIEEALLELRGLDRSSEKYGAVLDKVERLYKIRMQEKSDPVSKETMAVIAANLLGIFLIIRHERVNVITSRAMNLLPKPRQV